jgi:hypothetical protein
VALLAESHSTQAGVSEALLVVPSARSQGEHLGNKVLPLQEEGSGGGQEQELSKKAPLVRRRHHRLAQVAREGRSASRLARRVGRLGEVRRFFPLAVGVLLRVLSHDVIAFFACVCVRVRGGGAPPPPTPARTVTSATNLVAHTRTNQALSGAKARLVLQALAVGSLAVVAVEHLAARQHQARLEQAVVGAFLEVGAARLANRVVPLVAPLAASA